MTFGRDSLVTCVVSTSTLDSQYRDRTDLLLAIVGCVGVRLRSSSFRSRRSSTNGRMYRRTRSCANAERNGRTGERLHNASSSGDEQKAFDAICVFSRGLSLQMRRRRGLRADRRRASCRQPRLAHSLYLCSPPPLHLPSERPGVRCEIPVRPPPGFYLHASHPPIPLSLVLVLQGLLSNPNSCPSRRPAASLRRRCNPTRCACHLAIDHRHGGNYGGDDDELNINPPTPCQ